MWVFDATPLIYLAKGDCLALLDHLDAPRVVPERVHDEVVTTGLAEGYPDARRIERAIEDGVFQRRAVENTPLFARLEENPDLSQADRAVIACADAHDGVAVMDETYGRNVAAAEGVTTRGTAYLVLRLVDRDVLSVDEGRTVVDGMIDEGWYCAPDVYARIVRKLDEIADR